MHVPSSTSPDFMGSPSSLSSTSSPVYGLEPSHIHAHSHGVSWGAIFAGAVAMAALSLILLMLGFGLGLSAVSPWSNEGASATAIGVTTIVWVAFTQIIASGLGGYLAGRLRVKWASVHHHEVYFRDTAHGLVAWSLATVVTAALLTSAITGIIGGGLHAGADAGARALGGAAQGAAAVAGRNGGADQANGYWVDSLFRSDQASADPSGNSTRAEVLRIFANDLRGGNLSPVDKQYLTQLVAQKTGLTPADAESRVTQIYNRAEKDLSDAKAAAQQAADEARKAAAMTALWMFVALLCGAFFASLMATFGGKQRDLID